MLLETNVVVVTREQPKRLLAGEIINARLVLIGIGRETRRTGDHDLLGLGDDTSPSRITAARIVSRAAVTWIAEKCACLEIKWSWGGWIRLISWRLCLKSGSNNVTGSVNVVLVENRFFSINSVETGSILALDKQPASSVKSDRILVVS